MKHLDRLQKARIALLLDEPFFGSLLMQLKPVVTNTVPRMRTNGATLWCNPDFLDTLNEVQLRTILAHETMHCALLHPYRLGDRDLRTCNIAADYAINNFLDNYNQEATQKRQTTPFEWPKHENGQPDVLIDHQYDGMSMEEIYHALMNKPPGDGGNKPQPQPGAGAGQGQGQGTAQPDPNGQPGQQPGADQAQTSPSSPGEIEAPSCDEAEAQAKEANWKVALKSAATMAKSQGRIPAGIDRFISEFLDPGLSWREILRNLLTSVCKDDYSWARPNPRYLGRGIVLPSLHSPRLGRIIVAVDTSGSIGQTELDEFMAEVNGILYDCRPETLITCQCDAEIHEWTEHQPLDPIAIELKGGGGTDFRPVFDRIAQEPEPPAALVYLTDLDGDFPDEAPAYPVIWACNNDRTAPFGETVHI
jgi:predicted metal-dependent peptidase